MEPLFVVTKPLPSRRIQVHSRPKGHVVVLCAVNDTALGPADGLNGPSFWHEFVEAAPNAARIERRPPAATTTPAAISAIVNRFISIFPRSHQRRVAEIAYSGIQRFPNACSLA